MRLKLPGLAADGLGLLGYALAIAALIVAGCMMLLALVVGIAVGGLSVATVVHGGFDAPASMLPSLIVALVVVCLPVSAIVSALHYLDSEKPLGLLWAWSANALLIVGALASDLL